MTRYPDISITGQNVRWASHTEHLINNENIWKHVFLSSHTKCYYSIPFFIVFTSDHHTFFSLLKVRRHVIGCINHNIVVAHCSELLMRLSICIHLRIWKKLKVSHRDRTRQIRLASKYSKLFKIDNIQIEIWLEYYQKYSNRNSIWILSNISIWIESRFE